MIAKTCLSGTFALLVATALAAFRPTAVPIVSSDPFFSIWMPHENPTLADSEIWFGAKQPIRVVAEIDGRKWRLFGGPSPAVENGRETDLPAMRFEGCSVRALTTEFRFAEPTGVRATLSFMTPKFTDDLDVFSRPVTYGKVVVSGARSVKVFVEISPALATNDDRDYTPKDLWLMAKREATVEGLAAYAYGKKRQKPLSSCGDTVRCDWGWAWLVNPEGAGNEMRFLLAYDDLKSVEFLGEALGGWWRRTGQTFAEMLASSVREGDALWAKAQRVDQRFARQMESVGGSRYCALAELAYRQSFAACQLVADKSGRPFYFSKENSSNGSMGTVDVLYPQLPLLLLTSSVLTRATLEPILVYASSGKWPYPYAPHDIGTYPWGNGQTYQFDPTQPTCASQTHGDSDRMPVEECGNMLIALAAEASVTKGRPLAFDYWPTVVAWADYLEKFGFDPGNQLCTDDFAGHLAHNANLSIKSILSFAAFARLAKMKGDASTSERFQKLAESSVAKWLAAAKDGETGGCRLAFDQPGSWSLKYNLVWDRVLGFNLFPPEVARAEMTVYRRVARPFGVPIDNRREFAKVDWMFWCGSLTGERADLDFFTDLVSRYVNETPDRHPFPDWYFANNARVRGFLGRSVIGGVLMPAYAAHAAGQIAGRSGIGTNHEIHRVQRDTSPDRVETPLRVSLPRIGTIRPRGVTEIHGQNWRLGCEILDRDYLDFNVYKEHVAPLGIKTVRLQGGWAKCEKAKGKYDFAWLDRIVDYLRTNGVDCAIETSYGNPIYKGGGTCDLAAGFPTSAEGLAGWDKWVDALANHFKGRVDKFLMWNEPDIRPRDGSAPKTPAQIAAFNVRTAKIIRRTIPNAQIAGLSLARNDPDFFEACLKAMGEDVMLFNTMIYHGYEPAPETSYADVEAQKAILAKYNPSARMWQGENGCPSEMAHKFALSHIAWSEYSQAKWDMRRMLGDLGHDVFSSVYTICDFPHLGREINRKGLLRADEEGKVIGIKRAYYAVQNVVSVFDDTWTRVKDSSCDHGFGTRDLSLSTYHYVKASGEPLFVFWTHGRDFVQVDKPNAEYVLGEGKWALRYERPGDSFETRLMTFRYTEGALEDPVWVDLLTGRVYAYPKAKQVPSGRGVRFLDVPVYDSPCLLTERTALPY